MAASIFGIETGAGNYPAGDNIKFGCDFAHSDFVIPMARFKFYDPDGTEANAPIIYIRMPGSFNSTLSNNYSESQGIFGKVTPGSLETGVLDTIGKIGGGFVEALQRQIAGALAGSTGFIASAGNSGRAQVEFLQRRFLNNFQQLVYQGPIFRRFQLPFIMKPTSEQEAEAMIDIIASFRIASSPKGISSSEDVELKATLEEPAIANLDNSTPQRDTSKFPSGAEGDKAWNEYLQRQRFEKEAFDSEQALLELAGETDVLTFGYPDMCKFDIILYIPQSGDVIEPLFKSEFCMIENVAVDYGQQNKMTFFDKSVAGKYYPSEVNLTISLRESVFVTAAVAGRQYTGALIGNEVIL